MPGETGEDIIIEGARLHLTTTEQTKTAKILRGERVINLPVGKPVSGPIQDGDILVLDGEKFPLKVAPLISRPSRRLLYFVLIILVTLISVVSFQLRSKNLENQNQKEQIIEKQARDGLDAAQKLTGLNDNLARQTLNQVKSNFLNQTKDLNSKRLKNILAEIDKQLAVVGHVYQFSNLEVFSDFSLLRAEAKITAAGLHGNRIVALDSNNGAVYSLGTKSKTVAIINGQDNFKNHASVDFSQDKGYVFTGNGIYFLSLATPGSPKQIIKSSDKWGEILSLKNFAANLYLLDKTNSQIWKYQGTDFGLGEINPYLRVGGVDFSRVMDWAIDGSVWILSKSGNLVKLSGGYPEDFNISGLDNSLQNPSSLFITDETNNVYILDQNRVVILDKKGVYQAQYLLTKNDFNLILADETVKKVFLFSGSKVYSFDLK